MPQKRFKNIFANNEGLPILDSMKNIAVFFKQPGAKDYPFTKEEYWNSYHELDEVIRKLGSEFYVVRHQDTYVGNGLFSHSWRFKDGELVEFGPVNIDVLYDKGEFQTDNTIPILNGREINEICTDKYKTYELFGAYCPETLQVHSNDEFLQALKSIPGEKKVIKPVDDEEGNGVFIGDDAYIKKCPYEFPLLVQEFLDSTKGIPGIIDGIHDFRVAILNGEIVYAFVRTPPEGSLLANIALGGKMIILEASEIPDSIMEVVNGVDSHMKQYGIRFYGIDVAFTPRGPKIIELNSRLGLHENSRHSVFVLFKQKLAELLVNLDTHGS